MIYGGPVVYTALIIVCKNKPDRVGLGLGCIVSINNLAAKTQIVIDFTRNSQSCLMLSNSEYKSCQLARHLGKKRD